MWGLAQQCLILRVGYNDDDKITSTLRDVSAISIDGLCVGEAEVRQQPRKVNYLQACRWAGIAEQLRGCAMSC